MNWGGTGAALSEVPHPCSPHGEASKDTLRHCSLHLLTAGAPASPFGAPAGRLNKDEALVSTGGLISTKHYHPHTATNSST